MLEHVQFSVRRQAWGVAYSRIRGRRMAGGSPPSFISFTCANCQALYHVVKVEAGPETTEAEVTCCACGAPLPGREGKFVLKYFMLRHGARRPVRRRGPAETRERPEETI